eukprot:5863585-Pleurochrysis_carterae.AAC.1
MPTVPSPPAAPSHLRPLDLFEHRVQQGFVSGYIHEEQVVRALLLQRANLQTNLARKEAQRMAGKPRRGRKSGRKRWKEEGGGSFAINSGSEQVGAKIEQNDRLEKHSHRRDGQRGAFAWRGGEKDGL